MIIYLTFNDSPSGIFTSQVVDVVKFLRSELNSDVKLVSIISARGFVRSRKRIKDQFPGAIVLPMFPGVRNWKRNRLILRLLFRAKKPGLIVSRSVLATNLALMSGHTKVVYDGRGAIAAEWHEYKVIADPHMLSEVSGLEKNAVLRSHSRIAVSHQLVEHWKSNYGYKLSEHVVIPCTIGQQFESMTLSENLVAQARTQLGFREGDLVFTYSGSVAGWQGFEVLYNFLVPILSESINHKLFLLSELSPQIEKLTLEFPGQVVVRKASPLSVPSYLIAADFGLLIREETVTNSVASPVKFAEYLACGLPVIISPGIGDFTRFVENHSCGWASFRFTERMRPHYQEKVRMRRLALQYLTKTAYKDEYLKVVSQGQTSKPDLMYRS